MVSDAGLIAMSLISLAGMVLIFTMNNSMWFKKQNFKVQLFNVKAQNKLTLEKMRREMGLNKAGKEAPESSPLGGIEKLLPLLKNLDEDTLGGLVSTYMGSRESTGEEGPIDMLMGFAEDHPEVVKGLISGLTGGKHEEEIVTQV